MKTSDLNRQLNSTMRQIEIQIMEVRKEAVLMDIDQFAMRDSHGNYVLSPLIVAKAHVLHAIVLLHEKDLTN